MKELCEKLAEQYAEDKSKAYYIDQNGDQKWYITERGRYSKEDFLAGYKAARQWISVKDRLPEVNTDVLVKVSKGWVESDDNGNNPKPLTYDFYSVMSLYYENNQHVWDTRPVTDACPLKWEDVTHWMPLPAPPKEEE